MLQRALGVGQDGGEEDEDPVSAVPSSGEEYLKQVMREAKRLDDVVTGEYGHVEVRSSFYYAHPDPVPQPPTPPRSASKPRRRPRPRSTTWTGRRSPLPQGSAPPWIGRGARWQSSPRLAASLKDTWPGWSGSRTGRRERNCQRCRRRTTRKV